MELIHPSLVLAKNLRTFIALLAALRSADLDVELVINRSRQTALLLSGFVPKGMAWVLGGGVASSGFIQAESGVSRRGV